MMESPATVKIIVLPMKLLHHERLKQTAVAITRWTQIDPQFPSKGVQHAIVEKIELRLLTHLLTHRTSPRIQPKSQKRVFENSKVLAHGFGRDVTILAHLGVVDEVTIHLRRYLKEPLKSIQTAYCRFELNFLFQIGSHVCLEKGDG